MSDLTIKQLQGVMCSAIILLLSACADDMANPPDSITNGSSSTICRGSNDFTKIPEKYIQALTKYTTTNSEYLVNVCTEDNDGDGIADYMVVESTNMPEHESVYYEASHKHYEDYDYETNIHKFSDIYDGSQYPHSAGNNMIEEQGLIMKMSITPSPASNKASTPYATIGLAINGVSFFNENAAPGDEITEELFTFDQCSGHPQQSGVYHYHVDPVCLIRDLGGSVEDKDKTVDGSTYYWIEDSGTNADLLLGFLLDGFPVYGPVDSGETDCHAATVPAIDQYNGHSHCTGEFNEAIYHYHVKTANGGGLSNPVFWVTNEFFYGVTGEIIN